MFFESYEQYCDVMALYEQYSGDLSFSDWSGEVDEESLREEILRVCAIELY